MTTTYLILAILLLFSAVAICMLAKKIKTLLHRNRLLAIKNDELRSYLTTMNSELDNKDAELAELAQDPNSLIGVKYRTQAKIRENMRLQSMRAGQE